MVKTITKALEKVDVLVTTGSVSMGDRDILKPVLQKYFKATIHFGIFLVIFLLYFQLIHIHIFKFAIF